MYRCLPIKTHFCPYKPLEGIERSVIFKIIPISVYFRELYFEHIRLSWNLTYINYLILFIIWDISDEYSSVPSDELVDYAHFCAGQLQNLQLPACSHPKDLGENGHQCDEDLGTLTAT